VASNSIKEAFAPPYRGKPLESFSFPPEGLKGLRSQKSVSFSIEVDFTLSDFVVERVNEWVGEIENRYEVDVSEAGELVHDELFVSERKIPISANRNKKLIEAKNLRYRIEIEMLPDKGVIRVADEYLAGIDEDGKPPKGANGIENCFLGTPKKFKGKNKDKRHRVVWMKEGTEKLISLHVGSDHSALSQHACPSFSPYLTAAREEIASWSFAHFEPRERMRTPNPVKSVRRMGLMGEDLPAYLNTLKVEEPRQFEALEKSLTFMLPGIEGIDVQVNDHGEVELSLKKDGILISSRVLSDGVLCALGLLGLSGSSEPPSLVGLEEPANGLHPRRIEWVAEILKVHARLMEWTQYIVTTHFSDLVDWMPKESLFLVSEGDNGTQIDPFDAFGPLGYRLKEGQKLSDFDLTDSDDPDLEPLSVSERVLRGDFGG
ncbi:MAG: AAA family ATPase, partial [Gammaproteobacteria bacterium AqS3]|nr:AAA family ATPase [Gammaproteobacteria bacterium AqS3]